MGLMGWLWRQEPRPEGPVRSSGQPGRQAGDAPVQGAEAVASQRPSGRPAASGYRTQAAGVPPRPRADRWADPRLAAAEPESPEVFAGAAAPASAPAPAPARKTAAAPAQPVDTSALNSQITQAVQFSNAQNSTAVPQMVRLGPEMMVETTTGLAVQDAAQYMNAIMQIAVAGQAVAIKLAAEGPKNEPTITELMQNIQKMVTESVTVYGNVAAAAGTANSTVIGDLGS